MKLILHKIAKVTNEEKKNSKVAVFTWKRKIFRDKIVELKLAYTVRFLLKVLNFIITARFTFERHVNIVPSWVPRGKYQTNTKSIDITPEYSKKKKKTP